MTYNTRTPEVDIDSMFCDRWSPRSFLPDPITDEELKSLFEAARWAPSCFNEQPWVFLYSRSKEDRERFVSLLTKINQLWAVRTPVLLFLVVRINFAKNGKENRSAEFDGGAAWLSLALQARKRGLYAHAMAGFDRDRSYEVLGVPKDKYKVMAAIAIGRKGGPEQLTGDLLDMESPNTRKPLSEVAFEGLFPIDCR